MHRQGAGRGGERPRHGRRSQALRQGGVEPRFEALVLDFLAYLEFERGLARNTLDAYRTDLLQYGVFLAKRDARRPPPSGRTSPTSSPTSRPAQRRWRQAPPCSPATINRKAAALRSFYRHLRREELVSEDPTAALSPPAKSRKLPQVLSYAEVKKLLETATGTTPIELRDRALLEVMYGCGLRASEVAGLEVTDFDLRRGFVRPHGKGSKERFVPDRPRGRRRPSAATCATAARSWSARARSAKLFVNFRGGPLTRQGLYKIIQRHAKPRPGSPAR